MNYDPTPRPQTVTGPRSFKAKLTHKRSGEEFLFGDESMGLPAAMVAIRNFEEAVKVYGYGMPRRTQTASPGLPNFTAPAFSKSERHWLGREVAFKNWSAFTPAVDGESLPYGEHRGVVSSLSPYPRSVWVYVAGSGFYSVRETDLLTGVNASPVEAVAA